jgi:molybdate transport system ATP-binding protein
MLYVTHSPAEAIALGSRLFLLQEGRIISDGPPLDVLNATRSTSRGSIAWEGIRNVFPARVVRHAPEQRASHVELDDGPPLIVPFVDRIAGDRALVEILASDILLASQAIAGLSARNQIPGTVERIVSHGPDAEVVVRTGGLTWIVSLVSPAVAQLGLVPGTSVFLVVKARSCHVLRDDPISPNP